MIGSSNNDTIVALATAPGFGAVGILRISGAHASDVAQSILGKVPKPRYADYLTFHDLEGKKLDKGIALWFPAPRSFTGEDVLELQGHGGPIILDLLLKNIICLKQVRMAKPGEFSERAFINNKIDLTQAEAIIDLIYASSEKAARSAVHSLQGVFSNRINKLISCLIELRAYVEASIDFPEESDSDFFYEETVNQRIKNIINHLNTIRKETKHGCLLREGIKVVIAGNPNVGKSTLLNALTGRDTAIVSDIVGTTRDVLNEYIHIDGIPLHIIDTAGLHNTQDPLELLGIERAWKQIKEADLILFITDATRISDNIEISINNFVKELNSTMPIIVIRNKIDITGEKSELTKMNDYSLIGLSAHTGYGMDVLRHHIKTMMGFNTNIEDSKFLARRRHLESLELADSYLRHSQNCLISNSCSELLAEELKLAQRALSKITGEFTSNDLLSEIFSSFCIGK